jgi:hypothetical protein
MEGWAGGMMGDMVSRDAGSGLACGKRMGEENGGKRREAILGSESMTSKFLAMEGRKKNSRTKPYPRFETVQTP